jgi:hypothetical protein
MVLFIFFNQITSSWFRLLKTHHSAITFAEGFKVTCISTKVFFVSPQKSPVEQKR